MVPVNSADLGRPPVAASYYLAGGSNVGLDERYPAGTIFDDMYRPLMRLNDKFRLADPQWATCFLDVA